MFPDWWHWGSTRRQYCVVLDSYILLLSPPSCEVCMWAAAVYFWTAHTLIIFPLACGIFHHFMPFLLISYVCLVFAKRTPCDYVRDLAKKSFMERQSRFAFIFLLVACLCFSTRLLFLNEGHSICVSIETLVTCVRTIWLLLSFSAKIKCVRTICKIFLRKNNYPSWITLCIIAKLLKQHLTGWNLRWN